MNTNETTTESVEETEPAENAENTEKLGNTIMVSEIFIFTCLLRICSLIVISESKQTLSEKGLTQHMWIKK